MGWCFKKGEESVSSLEICSYFNFLLFAVFCCLICKLSLCGYEGQEPLLNSVEKHWCCLWKVSDSISNWDILNSQFKSYVPMAPALPLLLPSHNWCNIMQDLVVLQLIAGANSTEKYFEVHRRPEIKWLSHKWFLQNVSQGIQSLVPLCWFTVVVF